MILKFRAWDKENKIMLVVNNICNLSWESKFIEGYEVVPDPKGKREYELIDRRIDLEDAVLMQSTGLLDKNGDDIFEGDVVELHHFTENYSTTGGFYEGEESLVGVVRYGYTEDEIKYFGKVYPPSWFFENRYRVLDFSYLSGLHEESFKIIGDIYRNPELLEELK